MIYSVTELECLAVVKAVDHFVSHLVGNRFNPKVMVAWRNDTEKTASQKYTDKESEWDKMLKYLGFACRSAPHANIWHFPFKIIYEKQMHGPLDVIHDG